MPEDSMWLLDLLSGKNKKIAKQVIHEGGVIIDVRTESEFLQGHVQGSINIPLDQIECRTDELVSMNKPLVLCCASGMRSGAALSSLKQAGIECYNGGSWMSLR